MEVHHAHHSGHKKNWKQYITEFIMLFAAVSLGFLAENIREQYVEEERAHEFISRFEVDVQNNIHFFDSLLTHNQNMEYQMDSAMVSLIQAEKEYDLNFFFNYVPYAFPRFLNRNDTYEQMKSSGSLRYIKDEKLLGMMIDYSNETIGAEYRSKEQEASYVLNVYSDILTKWSPANIAVKRYLGSFQSQKDRLHSPDSTIQLLKKVDYLLQEKPFFIKGSQLQMFKSEMLPVLTRRMGLMKSTMTYFQRAKTKGENILHYLHEKHS